MGPRVCNVYKKNTLRRVILHTLFFKGKQHFNSQLNELSERFVLILVVQLQ